MDQPFDQETLSDPGQGESRLTQIPVAAVVDGNFARGPSVFPTSSNAPPPADGGGRVYWIWAISVFLLLAVGLIYGQTLRHGFIGFDDQAFVYENPHITEGLTLPGIWWALTDGPFGEWYPLATLSHMMDCDLYGLNAGGHFLTNWLLHAASSVLLFLVLLRMTGVLWPSAWVAAIFAVHPLHVESVAWLAERRDVLSGLFFMLTLGAYALYAERPSIGRYLAVAGFLALGLMSKSMLVTVPFLLLLLDYWPLDRFRRDAPAVSAIRSRSWFGRLPVGCRLVVEKIPLMALAAASCAIEMSTHSVFRGESVFVRLSLASRLANIPISYAAYLRQSFYPVDLSPFYSHMGTHLPMTWVAGSLVLLVAITALALYGWRRWPYLPVGWFWFLGMLVPVLGLVTVGAHGHSRADRYMYLSQIGLSVAVAWGVWSAYRSRQSIDPARWRQWMLATVSGASVLALTALAWRQTSYWRDAETLWKHALVCDGQNLIAHSNVARVCIEQNRIDEAIDHLRETVADNLVEPEIIAMYHLILADVLNEHGDVDEALANYEQTVRLYPAGERGHTRLAMALAAAGQHDRAIVEFRESLRLSPTFWTARVGLAKELLAVGDASAAALECREVLKQEPNSAEAIVTLAMALAAEGKVDQAIPRFERALQLDPRNARAHFQLGLALSDLGRSQSAATHLNTAIQLKPDDLPMLCQTAWILATSPNDAARDGSRAVELARKAVDLSKSQELRAFDALAAGLAETGDFPAAIDAAEQASTMALLRGEAALADAIEQRSRLYRQGLPYHQPLSPAAIDHAPANGQ